MQSAAECSPHDTIPAVRSAVWCVSPTRPTPTRSFQPRLTEQIPIRMRHIKYEPVSPFQRIWIGRVKVGITLVHENSLRCNRRQGVATTVPGFVELNIAQRARPYDSAILGLRLHERYAPVLMIPMVFIDHPGYLTFCSGKRMYLVTIACSCEYAKLLLVASSGELLAMIMLNAFLVVRFREEVYVKSDV